MRFGMCTDLMNAELVAGAGFDYIETGLTAVATADEGTLAKMGKALALSGITVEAMNVMIPGSYRLTGPDADLVVAREYVELALDRAAAFHVAVQVFGSGAARNIPEGWPRQKGMEQLDEYLTMAGQIAADRGIAIAIEPLNAEECNIINTVSEGLELAAMVGRDNVGVLADWFHMSKMHEGVEGILAAGPKLLHCHVANPEGRRFPLDEDDCELDEFFGALKAINYQNRVSVEGTGAAAQYAATMARLKGYL